jgi:glycosyltransferase involved in cell wall biosynthesis
VPREALLFIYLGGLSPGRGIRNMMRAFCDPSVSHHLLVMGSGSLQHELDAARKDCARIHYLPPVPPADVLEYAAGADIGLCLYEDICLNHRYCLPNKAFEYLMSGLPVVVSRLPDLAGLVRSFNAGWQTDNDVESIVRTLRGITRDVWSDMRQGLAERTRLLGWHAEVPALLTAYEDASSRG